MSLDATTPGEDLLQAAGTQFFTGSEAAASGGTDQEELLPRMQRRVAVQELRHRQVPGSTQWSGALRDFLRFPDVDDLEPRIPGRLQGIE